MVPGPGWGTRGAGPVAAAMGLPLAMRAAAPATAQTLSIDLREGRVSEQVTALGRIGGISIVVADPRLWSSAVPALRGRMSAVAALRLIAARCGGEVEAIDGGRDRLLAPRTSARPGDRYSRCLPPKPARSGA